MTVRAHPQAIDSAGPGEQFFAITPSDGTNFNYSVRGIYVGVTGNVVCVNEAGTAVTFTAVPAGAILPVYAIRVNSTSTTATNMVGLY
jgi:hypothetical protein